MKSQKIGYFVSEMFLKQYSYLFNIPSTNHVWWGKWWSTGGFLGDVARWGLSTVLHGICWSRFVSNTSGRQCFSKVERHVQQRRHRLPHIGKTKQTQTWFMSIFPTNIRTMGGCQNSEENFKKIKPCTMCATCNNPKTSRIFCVLFRNSHVLICHIDLRPRHRNMQIEGFSGDSSAAQMWLFQSTSAMRKTLRWWNFDRIWFKQVLESVNKEWGTKILYGI